MTDVAMMPLRRTEGLKVVDLEGETLVYDLGSHKSHVLNETAALVWQQCDGCTPVAEVAARLRPDLPGPLGEDVVAFALKQLAGEGLLQGLNALVPAGSGLTRRELLGRMARAGAAAAVLPVVASLVAPRVAAAASPSPTSTPESTAAPTSTPTPTATAAPTSTPTPTATAAPTLSPPAAPSGLRVGRRGPSWIDLTWLDNSNNESGFILERRTDQITWALIYVNPHQGTYIEDYHIDGLDSGTTYYFRVRAYNTAGYSAYSNTVSAET